MVQPSTPVKRDNLEANEHTTGLNVEPFLALLYQVNHLQFTTELNVAQLIHGFPLSKRQQKISSCVREAVQLPSAPAPRGNTEERQREL